MDSGSSDNFLQPSLTHYLQLLVEPTYGLQVIVGEGHDLPVEGLIRNVEVHIQNHAL